MELRSRPFATVIEPMAETHTVRVPAPAVLVGPLRLFDVQVLSSADTWPRIARNLRYPSGASLKGHALTALPALQALSCGDLHQEAAQWQRPGKKALKRCFKQILADRGLTTTSGHYDLYRYLVAVAKFDTANVAGFTSFGTAAHGQISDLGGISTGLRALYAGTDPMCRIS